MIHPKGTQTTYQWYPSLALGVVFFYPTNLWTRQTSNHTFCRLRDIQDNLYILINLRKRDDKKCNVSCSIIYYGKHFVLGVDFVVCTSCLHFTFHFNSYTCWWCLALKLILITVCDLFYDHCLSHIVHVVEYFSVDYRTFPSMHILYTLYYSQKSYCLGYLPHLFTFGIPFLRLFSCPSICSG